MTVTLDSPMTSAPTPNVDWDSGSVELLGKVGVSFAY